MHRVIKTTLEKNFFDILFSRQNKIKVALNILEVSMIRFPMLVSGYPLHRIEAKAKSQKPHGKKASHGTLID